MGQPTKPENRDTNYTTIDLNDTGTTSAVLNPSREATVYSAHMEHGGSTAEVNLELTDGNDTAVLAQPGAGNNLEFGDTVVVPSGETLQINVTTAEGSAQTNTCVVTRGEQAKEPTG